jgi:uncharacterized protein (TIGR03032 family)
MTQASSPPPAANTQGEMAPGGHAHAPGAGPSPIAPGATEITVSRGFSAWMRTQALSVAFTSYQTGQLFLVGLHANGSVSFNQQNFSRAMGLCWQPGRLYLGSLFQVWRLENTLKAGEVANQTFDTMLTPRNAQTIGDVDIHEVGVDGQGRVIFVNTRYSCLCTLDLSNSFKPIWKPPFISKLAAEDRCHMNGLAMHEGKPRYVTAVSRSDVVTGWRARRHEGGVLIDVQTNRIVTDQLSMPHSPRVVGDMRLRPGQRARPADPDRSGHGRQDRYRVLPRLPAGGCRSTTATPS